MANTQEAASLVILTLQLVPTPPGPLSRNATLILWDLQALRQIGSGDGGQAYACARSVD